MNNKIIAEIKDGKIIPVCELNDFEIKAIEVALHHQWHKTTNGNGEAITCSQEMADTTYKLLQMFENFNNLTDE